MRPIQHSVSRIAKNAGKYNSDSELLVGNVSLVRVQDARLLNTLACILVSLKFENPD